MTLACGSEEDMWDPALFPAGEYDDVQTSFTAY